MSPKWSSVPGTPRAESVSPFCKMKKAFPAIKQRDSGERMENFHTRLGPAETGHSRVSPAPFPGSPFKNDRRKGNKRASHGVQRRRQACGVRAPGLVRSSTSCVILPNANSLESTFPYVVRGFT